MRVQVRESIDDISAADWNQLAGTQPFLRHEFLAALEHSGCVNAETGWQPQYLTCVNQVGKLIGALPLYLKSHSWGEYVFDWAWAEAYERTGRHYYPKLISAAPFSPVTGPRLLVDPQADCRTTCRSLVEKTVELAIQQHLASIHCLFPAEHETQFWLEQDFILRKDCQFHWHNRNYRSFGDYLAVLAADKRKKIKRERRRVGEADIRHRIYTGRELDESLLEALYAFYSITYTKRGRRAYLNRAFFTEIAATMPDTLLVNFAFLNDKPVACAVCFRDVHTLYGRHWGCQQEFHSLHFETCYYQWIEYCVREGLQHFNPGTQGEHKLARGFEPTVTWSVHWIAEPVFRHAIADFLAQETRMLDDYLRTATQHLPFRQAQAPRTD